MFVTTSVDHISQFILPHSIIAVMYSYFDRFQDAWTNDWITSNSNLICLYPADSVFTSTIGHRSPRIDGDGNGLC